MSKTMEYRIKFPITHELFKKYMNHFPYLDVLNKSEKDKGNFYYLNTKAEINYFKLNIKEADIYSSCVYNNDEYDMIFQSKLHCLDL